jgi:hypothetical protein
VLINKLLLNTKALALETTLPLSLMTDTYVQTICVATEYTYLHNEIGSNSKDNVRVVEVIPHSLYPLHRITETMSHSHTDKSIEHDKTK